MRLLVFGATGPTGLLIVREALAIPDWTVVIYIRSPNKLPDDLTSNPSLHVCVGQLDDVDAISKAMEGVDAVASALGPSTALLKGPFHPSGTPLAKAYAHIIEIMNRLHITRLLLLGTASITDKNDKSDVRFKLLVAGVAHNAYKDVVAIGQTVEASTLDWTILRVPLLNDKETRNVVAGYVGDGTTTTSLSRISFATFLLQEIQNPSWVQRAPLLSNPGH
ncbi:NAD-P-binding protein [Mycena floridula]|nr:NAD-P-binding protein [Mycena floridula]